jgi:DNA-binding MarR family transcriptional regulator
MISATGFPAASERPFCPEPTIDQLFAEPIVQQLMRRDRTDEATIRRLLQKTAAALPTSDNKVLDSEETNIAVRYLHKTAQIRFSRYECAGLTYLAQHPGVDRTALAHLLDIGPMTLFRILDQLQAADFVDHVTYPEDRRIPVVALTARALPIIECIFGLTKRHSKDVTLEFGLRASADYVRRPPCRERSASISPRENKFAIATVWSCGTAFSSRGGHQKLQN